MGGALTQQAQGAVLWFHFKVGPGAVGLQGKAQKQGSSSSRGALTGGQPGQCLRHVEFLIQEALRSRHPDGARPATAQARMFHGSKPHSQGIQLLGPDFQGFQDNLRVKVDDLIEDLSFFVF